MSFAEPYDREPPWGEPPEAADPGQDCAMCIFAPLSGVEPRVLRAYVEQDKATIAAVPEPKPSRGPRQRPFSRPVASCSSSIVASS